MFFIARLLLRAIPCEFFRTLRILSRFKVGGKKIQYKIKVLEHKKSAAKV
jgi:hypothetical protein